MTWRAPSRDADRELVRRALRTLRDERCRPEWIYRVEDMELRLLAGGRLEADERESISNVDRYGIPDGPGWRAVFGELVPGR